MSDEPMIDRIRQILDEGGKGCLIHFNGRTEIIPRNPTDFCSHGERKPERSE